MWRREGRLPPARGIEVTVDTLTPDRPDGALPCDVPSDVPSDAGRLARLAAAVDQLLACPVDTLDEGSLSAELAAVETEVRRLSARQTRIVASMTRLRAAKAAQRKGTDQRREQERAARDVQRELTDQHQWSPSKAKSANRLGRRLDERPPAVADAFDRGELPPANAKLLDELLDKLSGERHGEVVGRLLEAARTQDAVSFGRSCRQVLAELDHETALHDADRRHASRRAAIAQRPDGMTVLTGQWSGVDAEVLHTAVNAFRTPDRPGLHRSAEQRTADALIEALRVALRAGEAPEQHGIRPHIMVTVPYETIQTGEGCVEGAWTGPLPYGEVRRLLSDAGVARILTDTRGLPLEASAEVRSVPTGLYRFLLVRDGGCVGEGCDAPAAWCDVMHLDDPYCAFGRLSPDNAALGCRQHHRAYDRHGWVMSWEDERPVLRPPPRPPARRPSAGP